MGRARQNIADFGGLVAGREILAGLDQEHAVGGAFAEAGCDDAPRRAATDDYVVVPLPVRCHRTVSRPKSRISPAIIFSMSHAA